MYELWLTLSLLALCGILFAINRRKDRWLEASYELYDEACRVNMQLLSDNYALMAENQQIQEKRDLYYKAAKGSEDCRKRLMEEKRTLERKVS